MPKQEEKNVATREKIGLLGVAIAITTALASAFLKEPIMDKETRKILDECAKRFKDSPTVTPEDEKAKRELAQLHEQMVRYQRTFKSNQIPK